MMVMTIVVGLTVVAVVVGGTSVGGLTRGLATLPPRWIQEPSVVKRTSWQCTASVCVAGVHCWEICLG